MSIFEFDDVINTAKVIVNPEISATELKQLRADVFRLGTELNEYKDCRHNLLDEVNKLRSQLVKAWEVINAYGEYHDGEYEEIPEQKAGIAWLTDYENGDDSIAKKWTV